MNQQFTIYDAIRANDLKQAGLLKAQFSSVGSSNWVQAARDVALQLAAKNGEVNIEDVYKKLPRPEGVSPNSSGQVFNDKRFRFIRMDKSTKVSSRRRRISVWGLV